MEMCSTDELPVTNETVSFLDALQKKYSDEDYRVLFATLICQEREKQKQELEQENTPRSPEKRRNFAYPPCVVLQNFGISQTGPAERLRDWCAHLREVDLSFNQLSKWDEVVPLMRNIPALESLNLSFNPLKDIGLSDVALCSSPSQSKSQNHPLNQINQVPLNSQIRRLILNGTFIDCQVVLAILQLLTGVEELHLSLNGYSTFSFQPVCSKNDRNSTVKELHIDNNQLESWTQLILLGQTFPSLRTLFASQNPLRDLQNTEEERLQESFPALERLHINQTELVEWPALDKLHKLPVLHDVRLLGTSLWIEESAQRPTSPDGNSSQSTRMTPRQHVIARLPILSTLNGTPIDPLERLDAERTFLRYFHDDPNPPARYAELQNKHGPLTPLIEVQLGAPMLVDVGLTYDTTVRKPYRVNVKQTVGQLKKQLASVTGLSPTKCRLFYADPVMTPALGPEEMRFPNRVLHSYNVSDGDEFIILPK